MWFNLFALVVCNVVGLYFINYIQLHYSIKIGDLLLEVDGKPMIGSSRTEAMQILNDTGESVQ